MISTVTMNDKSEDDFSFVAQFFMIFKVFLRQTCCFRGEDEGTVLKVAFPV